MKKWFLFVLVLATAGNILAQENKLSNTLLWRISGKGLKKPSYLYGTMHLTDRKVFQLGDSVYRALEQTEGFAAELDMNRLGTQMINFFIREDEEKKSKEPDRIKDRVSEETWKLYKDRLEEKFGRKADKLTVDDLDEVESKLQVDMFKKGDMPTFLDAWLFGQARKQGKWVGGIEDIEDQLEHMDDDIEEKIQLALFDDNYYRGSLDWFIKVYTDQKLDTIDAFMYRENGKKDYIMIKRNVKMALRMDSLSAIRSTLFAVGAAHLPGDSGVIAMLRSRGFTVTPVISSKKVNPDKYSSKSGGGEWFPVATQDSSYNLQMPGIAEGIEMFEQMGLEMKVFFDIAYMKVYMTIGISLPEERKQLSSDSLFNSLKERYSAKGEVMKEKKIMANGLEGREYRMSTDEGEMRMQVFIPEREMLIMNMAFAMTEKSLNESETDKFFQSFSYNKNFKRPDKQETVWTRLDLPAQSFSVEIPLKPKETKDVISDEGRVSYTWQGVDMINQVFYGMVVWLMKEGMYDQGDDTTAFIGIKNNLKDKMEEAVVTDSSFITVNGYPGYRLSMTGKAQGEMIETSILSVKRGGIYYYIYAVYPPRGTGMTHGKRFLNSFRLLPYDKPELKRVTSPDGSFNTMSPFGIKEVDVSEDDKTPGMTRFIMYDTLAAVSGYVDRTRLPQWLWYGADTSFLHTRARQHTTWVDSLADYQTETIGPMKIARFTIVNEGNHIVKKVRLIINGDEFYEVFGYFAKQDLPGRYERFFDDFKVINEKKEQDRTTTKMDQLSDAMKTADESTTLQVRHWWDYLDFTKQDLPALQRMALKIYPDFDSGYYNNLNKKIFDKIEELDSSEHSMVDFIKNNSAAIGSGDEYIKPFVISHLSDIKTAESYKVLKEFLVQYPFKTGRPEYFATGFYDSLKLTGTLFPEIIKLAATKEMWESICGLTITLVDSNLLSKALVKEYGKYFIETAKRELGKDKLDIEDAAYSYTDIIRLLGIINTSESNPLLTRFSKFDNRELKFRTMIAMLENNLPVDNRNYLTFALTDEYRHELYDQLKRINKLKLFPAGYLSQQQLGASKLFSYGSEDEYVPDGITSIGERTVLYKGKQQKFYLYKVSFTEGVENVHYLGVAGPYSLNTKDMNSSHEVTGVYWEGEFDPKKTDETFKAYLKWLEDLENE